MLICSDGEEDDLHTQKACKKENYLWSHGISPPMKNVRKKRFIAVKLK